MFNNLDNMKDELDIKEPVIIKPKTKEVKIEDLKYIYDRISALPEAIGRSISLGNSTGVTKRKETIIET